MKNIGVKWLDGDIPLLLITFNDGWSGHDYAEMVREMSLVITSKADPVLIFVDFRANFTFPKQIISIITSSKQYYSSNIEFIAVITRASFVKYIYYTIKPILALDYIIVFANDIDDAYRLYEQYKTQENSQYE